MSNSIAQYLWRDGGDVTGKIASGGTTTTLTLTNPQGRVQFRGRRGPQSRSANDGIVVPVTCCSRAIRSSLRSTASAAPSPRAPRPPHGQTALFLFRQGDFAGQPGTQTSGHEGRRRLHHDLHDAWRPLGVSTRTTRMCSASRVARSPRRIPELARASRSASSWARRVHGRPLPRDDRGRNLRVLHAPGRSGRTSRSLCKSRGIRNLTG